MSKFAPLACVAIVLCSASGSNGAFASEAGLAPGARHAPSHLPRDCTPAARRSTDDERPKSVGSLVSADYPIRIHWSDPAYKQQAERYLPWMEKSWRVQVDELGFNAPVLPDAADGPELDVYVGDFGDWVAYVWPDDEVDRVSGDGLMSTSAYIAIDYRFTEEWVPVYATHEFNHVLQYATDFSEATLTLWEGVATAAQYWTAGDAGQWAYDVYAFQEVPWAPVLMGESDTLYEDYELGGMFQYGAALWVMHADQLLGDGDGAMGPALWQAAASEIEDYELEAYESDVLRAVTQATGQDLGTFLNGVARTRVLTEDRWDGRGLAEAEAWTEYEVVAMDQWLDAAELETPVAFNSPPMITGQAFVDIDVADLEGQVSVRVDSESGLGSALLVLGWRPDGSVLDVATHGPRPELTVDVTGVSEIVVAVSNLGPPEWDDDSDPYVEGDQVLSFSVQAEAAGAGCGCATGASGSGSWVFAVFTLLVVRRSSAATTVDRRPTLEDLRVPDLRSA